MCYQTGLGVEDSWGNLIIMIKSRSKLNWSLKCFLAHWLGSINLEQHRWGEWMQSAIWPLDITRVFTLGRHCDQSLKSLYRWYGTGCAPNPQKGCKRELVNMSLFRCGCEVCGQIHNWIIALPPADSPFYTQWEQVSYHIATNTVITGGAANTSLQQILSLSLIKSQGPEAWRRKWQPCKSLFNVSLMVVLVKAGESQPVGV